MPTFDVAKGALASAKADLLAVPAFQAPEGDGGRSKKKDKGPVAPHVPEATAPVAEALGIDLAAELVALGFEGSVGETARIPTRGAVKARQVLVVGVGRAADLDADAVRRAGAAVADAASKTESVATTVHAVGELDPAEAARAFVEGVALGAYRFTAFKSEADLHRLEHVTLHAGDVKPSVLKTAVAEAEAVATAVALVRDLVNTPPGDKRPPAFADRAREVAKEAGIKAKVLDEKDLAKGGYGGILGVGGGSDAPPRLVELSYSPSGAKTHVALVGKGITFDSGGLSIKPAEAMETMKMDMGGAATVLGVMQAVAALKLKVRITGLLALAENMPSGSATRPGDVLTIRGGKTVEVLNTDAEGRLVLADALEHARELEPDVIVDMATLTGAALIALGDKVGVVMSTDDDLSDALVAASRRAGEPFWPLPVANDQYKKLLDSEVADVKNVGGRKAGTITAGLFLHHFVGDDVSWAHLDIAGVAWNDGGREGYLPKGATGVPVRMLVEWLRER
ncbi:MAG: leucyl aminopeptidase [Actinobacteria bacterium]|nr:leucyl aminopeptidase [Actinomycetota bacterium]